MLSFWCDRERNALLGMIEPYKTGNQQPVRFTHGFFHSTYSATALDSPVQKCSPFRKMHASVPQLTTFLHSWHCFQHFKSCCRHYLLTEMFRYRVFLGLFNYYHRLTGQVPLMAKHYGCLFKDALKTQKTLALKKKKLNLQQRPGRWICGHSKHTR